MDFKTVQNRNQNSMSNQIKSSYFDQSIFPASHFVSFTLCLPPLSVNGQSFYAFEIIDFSRKFILLKSWELRKKGWLLNKVERRGVELKGDSNLAIVYFFAWLVNKTSIL